MKNKSAFIVLTILLFTSNSNAFGQTEKFSAMTGGTSSVSYSHQDTTHTFSINLSPNIGIFVAKNFMLGFGWSLGIGSNNTASDHRTTFSVNNTFSPIARYYFLKNKLRPFIYASAGYQSNSSIHDSKISNSNYILWQGGAGLDYFLTKNVALETTLGYSGKRILGPAVISSTYAISLGLQYFFKPRTKTETLTKNNEK